MIRLGSLLRKIECCTGITSSYRRYRAAVLKEFCESLIVENYKSEKLRSSEVRVDVYKCGVNASDVLSCQGIYENLPKLPFVPGFEFCGELVEVGDDVKGLSRGDRVIGLDRSYGGAFSEEVVTDASNVFAVDSGVQCDAGSSLLDSYCTAQLALVRRASLSAGSCVLVTAAAGGLGLAAVDLAANVYKCKVIAVCDTEDKASLVREKGAFSALCFQKKHIRDRVEEVTEGRGADVVFDAVGGDVFSECIKCVAHEGKVVVAGFASRTVPTISTSVLLPRSFSLIGLSLRHYRDAAPSVFKQSVHDVISMYQSGLISPHISAQFPLERVNDAIKFISDRKSTGKVLLDIR